MNRSYTLTDDEWNQLTWQEKAQTLYVEDHILRFILTFLIFQGGKKMKTLHGKTVWVRPKREEFDFTYTPKDGSKQAEKDVKEILEEREEDLYAEFKKYEPYLEEKEED